MAKADKTKYPKPKRETSAGLDKARKARGKPGKVTPGPPYRPKNYGTPEDAL